MANYNKPEIERLKRTMVLYGVPDQNWEGLALYIQHGVPLGGFLQHFLSNDLFGALARADNWNRYAVFQIASFLSNEVPSPCWGSPENVAAWIERGGLEPIVTASAEV